MANYINKDPYEQYIQYSSVENGIAAHASTYSFNIESDLFNQLTPEQQKIWRKEIEQAVISGGEMGVELARDARYKENFEVKEVQEEPVSEDLEEEIIRYIGFQQEVNEDVSTTMIRKAAHHFANWQKSRNANLKEVAPEQ